MRLIRLLVQTSWSNFVLVIVSGFLSGVARVGLLVLSNIIISSHEISLTSIAWIFFPLSIIMFIYGVVSQALLVNISERSIFNLRFRLLHSILNCPLEQFEDIETHRLLATLTTEVDSVSRAFNVLSQLWINLTIVGCCLIYLSWLSWSTLLMLLGFTVAVMLSYQFLFLKAQHYLAQAQETQEELFSHFQAFTKGIRELKLNRQRQQAFFRQEFQPSAALIETQNFVGITLFNMVVNWALILLFWAVGLVIFVLSTSTWFSLSSTARSGYVLIILYLLGPIRSIMETFPLLRRARISLKKIESLFSRINYYESTAFSGPIHQSGFY